jgi:hypothetical protein
MYAVSLGLNVWCVDRRSGLGFGINGGGGRFLGD